MNRSEIRTSVRTLINELTPGTWTDTGLNGCIDLAVQHVSSIIAATKEDYFTTSSTFQTISGTKSYAMPLNCRFIRRMEVYNPSDAGDITKLEEIRFPRVEAYGAWPYTTPGEPEGYLVRGTQFDLLPIPDAVYDMRIYFDVRQVSLATDVDSPNAPEDFHDMVVFWTVCLALLQNGDDPKIFVDLFNTRKTDLIETLISRGSDDSNPVSGYLEGY